jgi:hypothetical protein
MCLCKRILWTACCCQKSENKENQRLVGLPPDVK